MRIDNFTPHIVTGEEDNSFVGLKVIENQIHFYYPESYHFDALNFEKDDILDLLKTISLAKSRSSDVVDTNDSHLQDTDDALMSYVWIIEDYLKNGLYANTEKVYKVNQNGKINWKKTFKQQPIISNGNVIYDSIVAETKSPRDTMLVEAHRYCIRKSTVTFGWLYGLSPETLETIPNGEKLRDVYLDVIRAELDNTFDDEKHKRLSHMENVIIGLDEVKGEDSIVIGVDSYHYVYERMIDHIFGTEQANDYYPTFKWNLIYSDKTEGLSGPTIRPDSIMRKDDDIYIIDSKFYRYGSLDLAKTAGLPEASSIVKQITYGSYVKSQFPEANVYNIFIIPYNSHGLNGNIVSADDKRIVYVGNVSSDWEGDKTYSKIYTFLIDLRFLVKNWNRGTHEKEQDTLISMLKNIK